MRSRLTDFLQKPLPAVSLAFFRILFGILMFSGISRFILKGWVSDLYVKPTFYFPYYGFEWIKPLPEWAIYTVFAGMLIASLLIALGLYYRLSIISFFILFTYVELIDKTNYLNHYYFVSLITFLMIFLPLNSAYSFDSQRRPGLRRTHIPAWTLYALKLQIGIVYFFGGIAKIKYDWLFQAQPLKLWLSANSHIPLLGPLFDQDWTAYVLSWGAMIFDLTVPFFMLYRSTRLWAYSVIIIFHVLTAKLFYIGMFPYIMMGCTLLFFSSSFHKKCLDLLFRIFRKKEHTGTLSENSYSLSRPVMYLLFLFFSLQVLMPFRHLLYPGMSCWTEQGFRYSWNIMLIEKTAHIEFKVKDKSRNAEWIVTPCDYLTAQQEKMMSTQPDMIVQFAQYIAEQSRRSGAADVEVRAECYASLNGRPSRLYIDPEVDLSRVKDDFSHKYWILPLNE